MSQPIFPGIEDIMTILMGEMPSGVYATDRADSPEIARRSFSSSEIRAHAQVFANMYANLQTIYQNKFLTTVNPDGIGRWEKDLFIQAVNSALPFETRKANAIAKYRAQGGLSLPYMRTIVGSILNPLGIPFDIVTYNCGLTDGGWILDVSLLEISTYLAYEDPLMGTVLDRPYILDCNAILNLKGTTTATSNTVTGLARTTGIEPGAGIVGNGIPTGTTVISTTASTIVMSAVATATNTLEDIQIQNYIVAGLTAQDLLDIQTTAYTYELRIYGTVDAGTLSTLDQLLTQNEKGTVTHVIKNNFPVSPDGTFVDMGAFLADTLIDNINMGRFTWLPATYDIWDFGSF